MQAVDAGTRILPSIARGDNFATDSVRLHAFSFFPEIADMVTVTDTQEIENIPPPYIGRGTPHFHCRFIFPPVNVFPNVMHNIVDDKHGNETYEIVD